MQTETELPFDLCAFHRFLIEEKAQEAQRAKDMRECGEFFNGTKSALEIFEDQYVSRIIEKITIYDYRFEFRFRNGQEITVNE